jgi:tetratricopeptide (TPR) repeat protein
MSDNQKIWILAALLFAAIMVTYSNHWHNEFHFDDAHTIQNNVYIEKLHNIPLFFKDPKTFSTLPSHCSYRPLVSTTLAIDYHFGGLGDTFYFHLSTFILFLLQGILMYFMFLKILSFAGNSVANKYVSLFATAFYMLHPSLAETINYIISRSDTLSTLFVVMAFVVYQYSAVARKFYLYLIPVIIGCFAKPTAIMFAPMLVVYDILFEQKKSLYDFAGYDWKKILFVAIPSFVVAGGMYYFIKVKETGLFVAGGSSLYNYLITQPFVFVHYFSQFILPTKLSADTDWAAFPGINLQVVVGFLFFASLVFTMFYLSRFARWRPVVFGIAWFLLALVPTALVPLAEVMNDHRVFYPYIGLSLALTSAIYLLGQQYLQKIPALALTAFAILILCGYAYGTHKRNIVWHTEDSLWKDVATKSPKNGRGLMNYGLVFMGHGSYDTANYYFTKALIYCPDYSLLDINMAILKGAIGDKAGADKYFKEGIKNSPEEAGNYYFYARYLSGLGRKDEAIENYEKCIELVDSRMDARAEVMPLLFDEKRLEELKKIAKRTLEISPDDKTASLYYKMATTSKSQLQIAKEESVTYTKADDFLNLSLLCYKAEDYDGCIDAAKKAVAINPRMAEAWNNICSAYNAMNKFDEGIKACQEALKIKPGYALAQGNMDWAKQQLNKK